MQVPGPFGFSAPLVRKELEMQLACILKRFLIKVDVDECYCSWASETSVWKLKP